VVVIASRLAEVDRIAARRPGPEVERGDAGEQTEQENVERRAERVERAPHGVLSSTSANEIASRRLSPGVTAEADCAPGVAVSLSSTGPRPAGMTSASRRDPLSSGGTRSFR